MAWLFVCSLLALSFAARANAQSRPPVLLSQNNSTRAVALESALLTGEPFALSSAPAWGADSRTRVALFALNLQYRPGQDLSGVTVDAEDAAHRRYDLKVEYVGPVPGQEWMSALVVRLNDEMGDAGDVLVRVVDQGLASNRVRVGIGHVGGGLPDDEGARPSPAPFYQHLSGRVVADGAALAGARVTLGGDINSVSTTDAGGNYTFWVAPAGNYVLSVSKAFYDFSPSSRTFTNLSDVREGVDFVAARQKRDLRGRVLDDGGRALPNIPVTLTSGDGSTVRSTTDDAGSFTFAGLPAGFGYTIAPSASSLFSFPAQTVDQLDGATALVFSGVRRTYTVSGRVTDGARGLGGASVTLLGAGVSTTTDVSGNYSAAGAKAGFSEVVAVAKEGYVFEPRSSTLAEVEGDRQLDFQGTTGYELKGRVTDAGGRGVLGIDVSLSGTENATTTTRADGTYYFIVAAQGDYTIRPLAKEQGYYAYAPESARLSGRAGSRVADFKAALNLSFTPSSVLEFDGAPKTVDFSVPREGDYNLFWPDGIEGGHFFWEFWAMPAQGAAGTYLISDGYGGAHAILFGFALIGSSEPGRYQLFGDIWDGRQLTYFSSDQGPAPGEWGHFAVGWDGQTIVTYLNGVPVGKTAFAGPRISPGGIQGGGRLLIGGSDHNNLVGRIAQVRGYEGRNPREEGPEPHGGSVFAAFTPQTVFDVDGNMVSNFFRPSETIADLSALGQFGRQHPGRLRGTVNGVIPPCYGCPLPQFVVDPTAPDFSNPGRPGLPSAPVDTPRAAPAGALVFDSFSRRNSTYALGGAGGLGATEGGAAQPQTWRTNAPPTRPQPFGILNGRAVLLADGPALAWVPAHSDTGNLLIRVQRHPGTWGSGHDTGLSFRVVDENNYFFAYTSDGDTAAVDASRPQTLTVGYYEAGRRTELETGVVMPGGWTTLRVVTTVAGSIRVYADDTPVCSTASGLFANAVGAGLYNNASGLGLTNRWDEFTVFAAAQP